jgi:hypothetical protein
MMRRQKSDQGQLFYEFHLGDTVPEDHLVRKRSASASGRSGLSEIPLAGQLRC